LEPAAAGADPELESLVAKEDHVGVAGAGTRIGEREPCLACGGAGCGICKLTDAELTGTLHELPNEGPAFLCGFFPVKDEVVEALFACPRVIAALSAGGLFVDLGCGDGRVVVEAVLRLGCTAVGIEIDGELVAVAEQMAHDRLPAAMRSRASFMKEDFRHIVLRDAVAVFLFMPPHVCEYVMREVLPQAELGAGTVICVCSRPNWRPSLERPSSLSSARGGPFCIRLATYTSGDDSFSTLHCFEWRHG